MGNRSNSVWALQYKKTNVCLHKQREREREREREKKFLNQKQLTQYDRKVKKTRGRGHFDD